MTRDMQYMHDLCYFMRIFTSFDGRYANATLSASDRVFSVKRSKTADELELLKITEHFHGKQLRLNRLESY